MLGRTFISLILLGNLILSYGQTVPIHPDLGLHGKVIWLTDTRIRVEYDWSGDSQLLDWTTTNGSTLARGNGTVTIKDGVASVRSMVWKQLAKCTRIYVEDARAINSSIAHLNFITNVLGWTGFDYNPTGMIGVLYRAQGNYWLENESLTALPAPSIVLGSKYTIDIYFSNTIITAKSTSDNLVYSYTLKSAPQKDRQVAVGGWSGDTEWGKLIIEGEITPPVPSHSDMINIQSNGSVFAPVIEVIGTPVIEWIFDDSTHSAAVAPSKNYGSVGTRHNFLKVTPWSSLIGINVGYDAGDSGYGGFALVANQNVSGFKNLALAKSSLQYLCASHNPLTELDLTGLTALKFVELYYCSTLSRVRLASHPVLERLCIEDCNVDSLNLSGSPALADLRGALNNYTYINWGSTGQKLWHICIRDNPFLKDNLPVMSQFPALQELLTWNDNQSGAFICHSAAIKSIESNDNHYTSADISNCPILGVFSLSGSKLTSLNLGTADNLTFVQLKDCGLNESQVDYVLRTLDVAGKNNGTLELQGNSVPSAQGLVYYDNLKGRGWTITITIPVTAITITSTSTLINTDNGTLQLNTTILPANATDKTVAWSVVNGVGLATVNASGLVTAQDNGIVTIKGSANGGSAVSATFVITISNQIIQVTGITVNGASSITSDDGTLQLTASILPVNATNKSITWSLNKGTGNAVINSTGLVTATENGTVTAVAAATDGSAISGTLLITISNQIIPVTNISVTGATGPAIINTREGTLQLNATLTPSNATVNTVTWSISSGTGQASINSTGLVTAIRNGTVTARAAANDGSLVYGTLVIRIEIFEPVIASLNTYELTVRVPDSHLFAKISLSDMNGCLIETKNIESNVCVFDISRIPPGILIIRIYKSTILDVVKVIKPW